MLNLYLQLKSRMPRSGTVSHRAVGVGVDHLVEETSPHDPDHIVGINRGGAIVGGLLAKRLSVDTVELLRVRPERGEVAERTTEGVDLGGSTIALVDDRYFTGRHMTAASRYLLETYDGIDLQRAVLLKIDNERTFPGDSAPFPPQHYAFTSPNASLELPWNEG